MNLQVITNTVHVQARRRLQIATPVVIPVILCCITMQASGKRVWGNQQARYLTRWTLAIPGLALVRGQHGACGPLAVWQDDDGLGYIAASPCTVVSNGLITHHAIAVCMLRRPGEGVWYKGRLSRLGGYGPTANGDATQQARRHQQDRH